MTSLWEQAGGAGELTLPAAVAATDTLAFWPEKNCENHAALSANRGFCQIF
jgi:hypothetical protein